MNISKQKNKPKRNQYFWFIGLYLLSLVVFASIAYGLRWLIHLFN